MKDDLRGIIVNATSEMLDEPDEHGIYKTGRFYDRLEAEVTEHFREIPGEGKLVELMLETVKNSATVDQSMQRSIATYLEYKSHPVMTTKDITRKLFGGKEVE